MSGGVDSSVAALLLKNQGFEVVGFFMRLWHSPSCSLSENACCDEAAFLEARKVAKKIGIPLYAVDARHKFKKEVVDYFVDEYKNLRTPNPCVVCNQKIKFGWLLDYAKKIGCDYLATGHYARIDKKDGAFKLLKGIDETRDQSYFLYRLGQEELKKIIFPLGELKKSEVIALAKGAGIYLKDKKESREICFTRDFRGFLKEHLSDEYYAPGNIVDKAGNIVGRHQGIVNYTIGQRKGLSQSGQKGGGNISPLYVYGFDLLKNELKVDTKDKLFKDSFYVENFKFIDPKKGHISKNVKVKIRYGAIEEPCSFGVENRDIVKVNLKEPLFAPTVGQSAVFYSGDEVIGGGVITVI